MSKDDLIVGVLDTSRRMGSMELARRCRDFTISCCRFDYFGSIIESDSIDDILEQASRTDHRYCLVVAYGHVMIRYRDAERAIVTNFIKGVKEWASRHDFFVAGRVVDGQERWYGLDDLSLLVSLQEYRELGKPAFHRTGGQRQLPASTESRETTTGESSLSALRPAAGEVAAVPDLPGWNLIATSLRHGKPVRDFDEILYRCRYDLRPEDPSDIETINSFLGEGIFKYGTGGDANRLSEDWRGFLDFVKDQATYAKRGIFLKNWESYSDVEGPPKDFRGPVSNLYGVAAGFKPNRILETHGFDKKTRVVFFDYSEMALGIKRALVEEWDGADYPGFIERIAGRFPDTYYQLWGSSEPGTLDLDLVAGLWEDELETWGGRPAFQRHWSRYRKLRHRFIRCDLFADPGSLLTAIRQEPGSVMWWSNAFHSLNGVWFYDFEERHRLYRAWLQDASAANPGLLLYGTDVDNLNIGGTYIMDQLEKHPS